MNSFAAARFLFLAVVFAPAIAQTSTPIVTPGQVDTNGAAISGAKLCAANTPAACYTMADLKSDGADYYFGLEPQVKTLIDDPKHPLFLFDARYSDGNKASLTRYTILQQQGTDASTHFVNVLSPVDLTNFSDFEVWSDPDTTKFPTVVSADFVWDLDAKEERTDPHTFNISVWRYKASAKRYALALSYRTDKKYPVQPTAVGVIDAEKENIVGRLEPKKSTKH